MSDDVLKKLLHKWETPETPLTLDRRVYAALRAPRSNVWIPMAAAAAGIVVVAGLWMRRPMEIVMDSELVMTEGSVSCVTTVNLTGFTPIRDGKLSVQKGESQ